MRRRPTREPGPDLFEVGPAQAPAKFRQPEPKLILPTDLKGSLAILTDSDLERLLSAVTREANLRGGEAKSKIPTAQKPGKGRAHTEDITAAKANLVRAALKAGVKPAAIARQFGISHASIRELLRSG